MPDTNQIADRALLSRELMYMGYGYAKTAEFMTIMLELQSKGYTLHSQKEDKNLVL